MFWENAVGYLRNSECWSFQTFAIVFSTPKNLLVEVSGALGMKESHFLSKNVFWENGVGISETVNAGAFKPLPLCSAKVGSSARFCVVECKSSLLWHLGDHWPKRFVCQVWFSSIQSSLCLIAHHCVQDPWKHTSRDFWSSRNKRKPLSKLKHVFRNTVEYLRNGEC